MPLLQISTFSWTTCKPTLPKALVIANMVPIFHHLKTATYGILFLGTPHRGSEKANIAIKIATMAKMIYPGMNTQIIQFLQQNSPELQDLGDDFRNLHSQLEIVSCYELEPKKMGMGLVSVH